MNRGERKEDAGGGGVRMKEKTAERWKQKSKGLTERRFPAAPLYLRLPQEAAATCGAVATPDEKGADRRRQYDIGARRRYDAKQDAKENKKRRTEKNS